MIGKGTNWREVGLLTGIAAIVAVVWNTPVVFPLKILVVFFHELSHAIAAMLSGGRVIEIQVQWSEGGHCVTSGGNAFLILTAGYLGSLVWGGVLLTLAGRTRMDKVLTALLGVLLLLVTAWLVRPLLHFGFAFGIVAGLTFLVGGILFPHQVNDVLLKLVGLTSCLYAVLDIKSDILSRPQLHSDARMLAELTHVPTLVWGTLWFVISLGAAVGFLLFTSRRTPTRR